MKHTLHLRGDPHTRVTIADSGYVNMTIPELRWINSSPRRLHHLVIEQVFRRRIREAGVKDPLLEGKVASSGNGERACAKSTKEKPPIHRSDEFIDPVQLQTVKKNQ
jgi:hypothetical protein